MHNIKDLISTVLKEFPDYELKGDEYLFGNCPFCGKEKKFYLNANSGLFNCKNPNCEQQTGNIWKLKELIISKEEGSTQVSGEQPPTIYTDLLKEDKVARDFMHRNRKIDVPVIKHLKWGADGNGNTVIPYLIGGIPKFHKFKNSNYIKGVNDKFWYGPGEEVHPTLYNSDSLKEDSEYAIVFEGEFDLAAFYTYMKRTDIAAVAIPGIDYRPKAHELSKFKKFKQIYLCVDNDSAGETGIYPLASIFGIERTKVVRLPLKDMNACLKVGVDLDIIEGCLSDALPPDIPGARPGIKIDFDKVKIEPGLDTGMPYMDKLLGGLPYGITLLCGDNGTGKSAFSLYWMSKMLLKGIKCMYMPFEGGHEAFEGRFKFLNEKHLDRVLPNLMSFDRTLAPNFKSLEGFFMYLEGYTKIHQVKVMIIDDIEYLFRQFTNAKEDTWQFQDEVMYKLQDWCAKERVCVIALHHTNKEGSSDSWLNKGKLPVPSKKHIKGSGGLADRSHIVAIMWRNQENVSYDVPAPENRIFLYVKKNKIAGTLGTILFDFNPDTKTYKEV